MVAVVNFFAGPGAGKSTMAYYVCGALKMRDIRAELASEYAKEAVWRGDTNILNNQLYVLAKQYERLWRLSGKVDIIITDSPLLMNIIYAKDVPESFKDLVIDLHRQFDNHNFFVQRDQTFDQAGRIHSFEESVAIDDQVKQLLEYVGDTYTILNRNETGAKLVLERIISKLQ